jgi:hypothetical protein
MSVYQSLFNKYQNIVNVFNDDQNYLASSEEEISDGIDKFEIDPNDLNSFMKFYQRCRESVLCADNLNPERLVGDFLALPSSEQRLICDGAKKALGIRDPFDYYHDIFAHPNFHLPHFSDWLDRSYFKIKVAMLTIEERDELYTQMKSLATSEGFIIEGWDRDWGQHHLFDHPPRLIQALNILESKKISHQLNSFYHDLEQDYDDQIADKLLETCPLLLPIRQGMISESQIASLTDELKARATMIRRLQEAYHQLEKKYPEQLFNDSRKKAWKGQEMFFLTFPTFFQSQECQRFGYLISIVDELIKGKYDPTTAGIILDRILTRDSFHPLSSDLAAHFKLKELNKIAKDQINHRKLCKAGESLFKDIFIIPSPTDKQGKLKPLLPGAVMMEVHASKCDRVFGFGMTAPTMRLGLTNFSERLHEIRQMMLDAANFKLRKDFFRADQLKQCAIKMLKDPEFPSEVRGGIFYEMYLLRGNQRKIDNLGEKLFYDQNEHQTTEREKALAIQNYLDSDSFISHRRDFSFQGSLQLWIDRCGRTFDLLVKDPDGGRKLKTAPKALAHLYALLGMFKGSMDCSSGNTLVEFDPRLNRVVNFWDMDDEKSMPLTHDFWNLRMWQLGLPQCEQPFDRAVLLLFSDPTLLNKLSLVQSSAQISPEAYKFQNKRVKKIITLFNEELLKKRITLTPRDLFFALFGGREDFVTIKKKFNDDKKYGPEGIRISPIELFEFHLPEIGRGAWYTSDDVESTRVGNNMKKLYFPNLP